MNPFFSIGVTTGSRSGIRLDMLRECLGSLLTSLFEDYEVVIGNDCPDHALTLEEIGFNDCRIRILNHPENLGEIRNMNTVLQASRGRYFTWLADDDMLASGFMKACYDAVRKYGNPECVFTSYADGAEFVHRTICSETESKCMTGQEFLFRYLSRELRTIGCYALFKQEYIRSIGGIQALGGSFSPYSDNLLAIKAGLLAMVIFIDEPLVFFRVHEGSLSNTCTDVDSYRTAQVNYIEQTMGVLVGKPQDKDLDINLSQLLNWCFRDYCEVIRRSKSLQIAKLLQHFSCMLSWTRRLNKERAATRMALARMLAVLVWQKLLR